jgi:signal transduction histidine kinase
LGLLSMHERVRLVEGTFRVSSRPGKGTRIEVWVPIPGK